jgi:hypothetical protein
VSAPRWSRPRAFPCWKSQGSITSTSKARAKARSRVRPVIIDPEWFDALDEATEDEEDMLDLAFGLTETSRLGCQIIVTEELDGITVTLPSETRNMMD